MLKKDVISNKVSICLPRTVKVARCLTSSDGPAANKGDKHKIYRKFNILLSLIIICLLPSQSYAERRALVVGIDAYENVVQLEKAVNDAEAIANALQEIGFLTDIFTDIDDLGLLNALASFSSSVNPGDEVVFFFAGHGIAIDGQNYLLPSNVPAVSPGRELLITRRSLPVEEIINEFNSRGVRLSILILDACRNNPFPQEGRRSVGRPSGLEAESPPEGTFILFSAGMGQEALDRLEENDPNPNSVFTRTLLPRLTEPGLPLRQLVQEVRSEVRQLGRTVSHEQFPAVYDQLDGNFSFVEAGREALEDESLSEALQVGTATSSFLSVGTGNVELSSSCAEAMDIWGILEESDSSAALQAFFDVYEESCPILATLASERLLSLTTDQDTTFSIVGDVPGTGIDEAAPELESSVLPQADLNPAADLEISSEAEEETEPQEEDHFTTAHRLIDRIINSTSGTATGLIITASRYSSVGERIAMQEILSEMGYFNGPINGERSPEFTAALRGVIGLSSNDGSQYEAGEVRSSSPQGDLDNLRDRIERGDAYAMVSLANYYEAGYRVSQSHELALDLFLRGAALGNENAMLGAARILSEGRGGLGDPARGARLYGLAASLGNETAAIALVYIYQDGNGVPQNSSEAARFFLSALENANSSWPMSHLPNLQRDTVIEIQRTLSNSGFYNGSLDGIIGPGSRAALDEYIRSQQSLAHSGSVQEEDVVEYDVELIETFDGRAQGGNWTGAWVTFSSASILGVQIERDRFRFEITGSYGGQAELGFSSTETIPSLSEALAHRTSDVAGHRFWLRRGISTATLHSLVDGLTDADRDVVFLICTALSDTETVSSILEMMAQQRADNEAYEAHWSSSSRVDEINQLASICLEVTGGPI